MRKYRKLFLEDIWEYGRNDLSKTHYSLLGILRIIVMAVHGFRESKCRLWASALTYFSIFALVPITALAFGIAKGFGLDIRLKKELCEKFVDFQYQLDYVFEYSDRLLEKTKGGMIAGIGVVLLFWAVIKMLGNIEAAFNSIWGVKSHRSLFRKFSDYLSIALICPILILAASSVTTFVQAYLSQVSAKLLPEMLSGTFIDFTARMLPFVILWLLFPFLYSFMPNTKVRWRAAIVAGVLTGTAFQLLQQSYLALQFFLSGYNTIYGSFSAVPLFLIWLQLSWLLVLFGAEISCAIQTASDHEFEPLAQELCPMARTRLMLAVSVTMARFFRDSHAGLREEELAKMTNIPIRLIRDAIYRLEEARVIIRSQPLEGTGILRVRSDEDVFYPGIPLEKFTAFEVMRMVGGNGKNYRPRETNPAFEFADRCMNEFDRKNAGTSMDKPLAEVEIWKNTTLLLSEQASQGSEPESV